MPGAAFLRAIARGRLPPSHRKLMGFDIEEVAKAARSSWSSRRSTTTTPSVWSMETCGHAARLAMGCAVHSLLPEGRAYHDSGAQGELRPRAEHDTGTRRADFGKVIHWEAKVARRRTIIDRGQALRARLDDMPLERRSR